MRASRRLATAGIVGFLLGGLLINGVAIATTTPRSIEHLTTDWPAQASIQGARISTNGQIVAFAADPTIPGVAAGSVGQHVFIRDLATSAIEQISVDSNEIGQTNLADAGGLSATGRFVTFTGSQMTPPAFGGGFVYVRDRQAGTTEYVSVAFGGGNQDERCVPGGVGGVDISDDGRYVAFTCSASNLLAPGQDANGMIDVFLRDRQAGTTIRINMAWDGAEADGYSNDVAISDDGSTVVFDSNATNLTDPLGPDPDTNGFRDVFAYDVGTTAIERVSLADDEAEANGSVLAPSMGVSADGNIVAFTSGATNLVVPQLLNPFGDVYVRNRSAGTTVKASVTDAGTRPNVSDVAFSPALSADGTRVAFASRVSLDPGDTSPWSDVYLRDLAAGTTELISRTPGGLGGDNVSGDLGNVPRLSIDGSGTIVVFGTSASDLVAEPFDDGYGDVVVSSPTPVDGDADGISDDIDANPGGTSTAFSDGSTFGTVVTVPAGFTFTITDALDPAEGVHIVVTGIGTQKVVMSVCGGITMRFGAGTDSTMTCGSVIVVVAPGSTPVEVVVGTNQAVITVPAGGEAEIDATPTGGYTVENVIGGSVTVAVNGTTSTVAPGGTLSAEPCAASIALPFAIPTEAGSTFLVASIVGTQTGNLPSCSVAYKLKILNTQIGTGTFGATYGATGNVTITNGTLSIAGFPTGVTFTGTKTITGNKGTLVLAFTFRSHKVRTVTTLYTVAANGNLVVTSVKVK